MIHYFKFRQDLFDPQPAKEAYLKRKPGRGWPDECPPMRAANSFGFDIYANFDITFIHSRGGWRVEPDVVIASDFDWAGDEDAEGAPLTQQYAWFWEKGQTLPHPISDNVYREIRDQVKVSSFLFLRTDPNELLYLTDIPNLKRPWRALTALIDTDWYPASYPWHVVLELDRSLKRIRIRRGEPICRVIPVRRDAYFAQAMTPTAFDEFFARGQRWLAEHGRPHTAANAPAADPHSGTLDITHTYVRQQIKSKFVVLK
jgi:hypothetical protein